MDGTWMEGTEMGGTGGWGTEVDGGVSALLAVLLAFLDARVARQEAFLAEANPKFFVEIEEGAGDAMPNGARAGGDSSPVDRGDDVELLDGLGGHERLAHDHLERFVTAEELVEALIVQREGAFAGAKVHAGDRGLTLARAEVFCDCCCQDVLS